MRAVIISSVLAIALPGAAFGQPAPEPAPEPAPVTATVTTTVSSEQRVTATVPVQADLEPQAAWSFGIAPRLAMTVPTSRLNAMIVGGLELAAVLPVADRRLVLALDFTITRPSYDSSGTDQRVNGVYTYTVHEREIKIGLDAIFRFFNSTKKLVPYVGAGPVIHLLKTTESASFAPSENMEQSTKLGFEIVGGADYRVGPGMLLAELRVLYSDLDHLFTGDTNAGSVMIGLGYRFVF